MPAAKQIAIVCVSLSDVRSDIKAHHERLIDLGPQNRQKKFDGRILFKLKAGTDGTAGVNHEADAKREIGLLGKAVNLRRGHVVVEQREVALVQIADEMAVLVGYGEDEIHFIDDSRDGVRAILLRFGSWLLGWVGQLNFRKHSVEAGARLFCRLGCGRGGVLRLRNILRSHQNRKKNRSRFPTKILCHLRFNCSILLPIIHSSLPVSRAYFCWTGGPEPS